MNLLRAVRRFRSTIFFSATFPVREPLPPRWKIGLRLLEKPMPRPLGPVLHLLEEKISEKALLSVLGARSIVPGQSPRATMLQGVRYPRDGEAERANGEG